MFFSPLTFLFTLLFVTLLGFLFLFVHFGIITYAFERIGMAPEHLFSLLLLTIIGSYINIPLYKKRSELEMPGQVIRFFGYRFIIPAPARQQETTVAINVGGALIPGLISLYLIITHLHLLIQIVIATFVVAVVAKRISRPIRGLGIASPPFISPLIAAILALILSPDQAPVVAYCAGTLGVLIGADLLNADTFDKLGAPVVSIGGAGTFDGVFFTGIFAVLLASL
ncbi:MAG: DUF1614 domain-containing protein [candidate division KSB1 bacterium]|nr:DUF1614 domain-containing protein [candidate division KSB1 bacterium]